MKVIKCLNCNTELVSDYNKEGYDDFVECGCENETSLQNYFTISQPGSIVRAKDKLLVTAQALQDYDFCKKGDWWILGSSDETLYVEWSGRLGEGGFTGGLSVSFTTPEPMTKNDCRTYLKTNTIIDKGEQERISRVDFGIS